MFLGNRGNVENRDHGFDRVHIVKMIAELRESEAGFCCHVSVMYVAAEA